MPDPRRPPQWREVYPLKTPSRHPHSAQECRLWGRCSVPTPTLPAAPGNTGNEAWLPGPRTGGRERESA